MWSPWSVRSFQRLLPLNVVLRSSRKNQASERDFASLSQSLNCRNDTTGQYCKYQQIKELHLPDNGDLLDWKCPIILEAWIRNFQLVIGIWHCVPFSRWRSWDWPWPLCSGHESGPCSRLSAGFRNSLCTRSPRWLENSPTVLMVLALVSSTDVGRSKLPMPWLTDSSWVQPIDRFFSYFMIWKFQKGGNWWQKSVNSPE